MERARVCFNYLRDFFIFSLTALSLNYERCERINYTRSDMCESNFFLLLLLLLLLLL